MKKREAMLIGIFIALLTMALFSIPLPKPPAPACKVCHCQQISCHRECGEEAMCETRCEGLCQTKK